MSYMEFYPTSDERKESQGDHAATSQTASKILPVSVTLPAVASGGFATTAILKK